MEIFINTQGTATKLSPQHVYQGTNVSQINLYAPFPSQTSLSVAFMLPDGTTTPYYPMTFTGITSDEAEGINLWQYVMPFAITQDAGAARVAFLATFNENGTAAQQTSAYVDFTIEQSALPVLPDEPTPDVWTQILSYLSAQDTKIAAIQSDVADIEQVADEANTNAGIALTTANEANTTATQAKTTANNTLAALNAKQDRTDNTLATEQKTVIGAINENKSAIDNLRDQIVNEAHFRGFFQSSSDLPTDGVDVNDYAYIADDNSIWIYGASGWTDSGQKIPDNATKVQVGSTTTGEAGTQANVTNSGTSSDVVLNFTIPRGDQGESQLVCYDVKLILGGEISVGTALSNAFTLFNRTPQVGDRFMILVYTAMSTGTVTGVYLAWAQVQSVTDTTANSTVTGYQSVMGMQGEQGPQGEKGVGIPDGGTAGQFLQKTPEGTAWANVSGSGAEWEKVTFTDETPTTTIETSSGVKQIKIRVSGEDIPNEGDDCVVVSEEILLYLSPDGTMSEETMKALVLSVYNGAASMAYAHGFEYFTNDVVTYDCSSMGFSTAGSTTGRQFVLKDISGATYPDGLSIASLPDGAAAQAMYAVKGMRKTN